MIQYYSRCDICGKMVNQADQAILLPSESKPDEYRLVFCGLCLPSVNKEYLDNKFAPKTNTKTNKIKVKKVKDKENKKKESKLLSEYTKLGYTKLR